MQHFQIPWNLGYLKLNNRLIQGPLAGVSASPFRRLFSKYIQPAYCVSEMISAYDVVYKYDASYRWLHRDKLENILCYQLSGNDPNLMATAAQKCVKNGGDLIDINAGCPKTKIRRKGAGSALLENRELLYEIISAVRDAISCPLTVKIRLTADDAHNHEIAMQLTSIGIDALIVHGREYQHDYDQPCQYGRINTLKQYLSIPLIVNGDIENNTSLQLAYNACPANAYMISRAGTGKPWIYATLLGLTPYVSVSDWFNLWCEHVHALITLEGEHKALYQSRTLLKYYLKSLLTINNCPKDLDISHILKDYYSATTLYEAQKILELYINY